MSFWTSTPSGTPFHSQSKAIHSRSQTPFWVFVCFCLVLAAGAGWPGRAAAGSQGQIIAAGCSELVINGGFEVKDLAWQTFGAESPPAYTTSPVFSGEQAMRLGIVEGPNLAIINGVRQTIFLPGSASSLILSFRYRPIHESLPGDDLQYLDIYDANSGTRLYQLHAGLHNSANWIFLQYDLTPLKGKNIRVDVGVRNDGGGGRTAMIIDDISLLSCDAGSGPTVTPTGLSSLATPTPTATSPLSTLTPTASVTATPSASPSASTTATPTPTPIVVTPATATPIPAGCVNILENGSFEQPLGSSTGWLPGDVDPVGPVLSSEQTDGLRSIQLGNPPGVGSRDVTTYSSLRQFVEIPPTASTAKLTWKHQSRSQEVPSDNPVPPQDRQELILLQPNLDTKAVRQRWRENVTTWQSREDDLTQYIGHSFYVYFNVFNDANSTRTWMFLDDVRLLVCYATAAVTATATTAPDIDPATPTPTGAVVVAALQETPTPDTTINQVGLPTPEASSMIGDARTPPPTVTASRSPVWQSFLSFVGRYRAIIFGGILIFVLVAIFALRR